MLKIMPVLSMTCAAIPVALKREFFAANRENNGNRIAGPSKEIIGLSYVTFMAKFASSAARWTPTDYSMSGSWNRSAEVLRFLSI